jgi:hypothetical protein
MSNNKKSITLTPSWKAFFWRYFFGVILTPLLIGIYLLVKTWKNQKSISYIISDRTITIEDGHISQNIDLVDIRQAEAGEKKFGVGSVFLKTGGRKIELKGLENPDRISAAIEKAIEAEIKRIESEKQTQPRETKYSPGTMDQLEYLTGLWQQGLIDDSEFEAQKQKLD